jgi:DNA gyrase subunit A
MAKRKGGPGPGPIGGPSRTVIEDVSLAEVTRSRYLNYALSVITSRALPDVRDGLKPVQRRILYAMWADLGVRSDGRYMKCAAVVGEVMKSYHPHGDQSIYQALVRMAQSFSLRYPLIDGYGNFGSIDGDGAAAMRYTECRLTPIAEEILSELNQATVNFRPNYASTTEEPEVLPAQFPNLLVNGASGIAVGMATNIPPHNLKEVCSALIALLDNRDLSLEKIGRTIQGPDFPTGGVILNSPAEIQQIYATGQGSIKLRGTYERDPEKPNSAFITSIPYGIEKDALVLRIGELIGKGQVPQLTNVKDLSTDDVRIALELRPGSNLDAAMAYLYKNTPLQSNFGVNLTCLLPSAGAEVAVPDRLDLKTMLLHFLDFRLEIVTRRLQFELNNLLKRIHILEGFAIVFNALDEAIAIIRASDGKADASPKLMDRFVLSFEQADAVLETKLYRLGKLEIADILGELAARRARAAEIEALLADEPARWKIIRGELKEISRAYGDERRTTFSNLSDTPQIEYREEDYIIDEDAWVIVSRDGWIKRQKSFTDVASIRLRDDDRVGWVYRARARQTVTFFTDRGIAYTMRVNDIPMTTGHGESFRKDFALDDGEHLIGVACHDSRCLPEFEHVPAPPPVQPLLGGELGMVNGDGPTDGVPPGPYGVTLTAGGKVLRFPLSAHSAVSNRKGRLVVRLDPTVRDDKVVGVEVSDGKDTVCLATRSARVLIFPVGEANVVSGAAKGVTAIKLKADDRVIGFALANRMREGLTVRTNRGATQIVRATKYPVTGRGGLGFGILQRGTLDAIIHDDAQPVPPVDVITET